MRTPRRAEVRTARFRCRLSQGASGFSTSGTTRPSTVRPDIGGLQESPGSVHLFGQSVPGYHLFYSKTNVSIHHVKAAKQDRQQIISKGLATSHPLVVVPPSVMIRPVELGGRDNAQKPMEKLLVPGMHSQSYLGMKSIAAEMPFTDQDPKQETFFEFGHALQSRGMLFHCQVSRETQKVVSPSSSTWNVGGSR
jgi:hypothetical protein